MRLDTYGRTKLMRRPALPLTTRFSEELEAGADHSFKSNGMTLACPAYGPSSASR
ncbi:hypothetical protein IE4872_PC00257 (plasmid) [Rhizobium gallicum]|uniref:Uncharacterized protein n=1 Tax=Rhizobium gallicum TaxID=56730 RepID=A0A1L5NQY2_9HYPH|nr:hypothetical protein IE4872_PC00257 [Rhizobium gallicum]